MGASVATGASSAGASAAGASAAGASAAGASSAAGAAQALKTNAKVKTNQTNFFIFFSFRKMDILSTGHAPCCEIRS
jgi:hypothetical protein